MCETDDASSGCAVGPGARGCDGATRHLAIFNGALVDVSNDAPGVLRYTCYYRVTEGASGNFACEAVHRTYDTSHIPATGSHTGIGNVDVRCHIANAWHVSGKSAGCLLGIDPHGVDLHMFGTTVQVSEETCVCVCPISIVDGQVGDRIVNVGSVLIVCCCTKSSKEHILGLVWIETYRSPLLA